jgi:hypothetical protein
MWVRYLPGSRGQAGGIQSAVYGAEALDIVCSIDHPELDRGMKIYGRARRVTASVTAAAGGMLGAIPGRLGIGTREDAGCGRSGGGHGAAPSTARKSW